MTGADADDDDHVEIVTFTIEEAVRRRAPREAPRASVALGSASVSEYIVVVVAFSQKNRSTDDLAPSPSSSRLITRLPVSHPPLRRSTSTRFPPRRRTRVTERTAGTSRSGSERCASKSPVAARERR